MAGKNMNHEMIIEMNKFVREEYPSIYEVLEPRIKQAIGSGYEDMRTTVFSALIIDDPDREIVGMCALAVAYVCSNTLQSSNLSYEQRQIVENELNSVDASAHNYLARVKGQYRRSSLYGF